MKALLNLFLLAVSVTAGEILLLILSAWLLGKILGTW